MSKRTHAHSKPTAAKAPRVKRTPLWIGAGVSVLILVTSFPAATLLQQRSALAASTSQLRALDVKNRQLAAEEHALVSGSELEHIARQDYQLVQPGQTLYGILPPAGESPVVAGATAGDPGNDPLVSPNGTPQATTHHGAARPSVVDRILHRLEFWQ